MSNYVDEFCWIGSQENFVDTPNIFQLNDMMIGRYGGNSNAGQHKNEDGCLVWINKKQDWEFAILLDSHNTTDSAELILEQFTIEKSKIKHVLSMPTNHQTFKRLEELILNMFQSEEFLSACRKVRGETACLKR